MRGAICSPRAFVPETVIKTGSPMHEVLNYYKPQIEASDVLKRLKLKAARIFCGQRPSRGKRR